ncbi:uncharacterized protein FFUJ_10508 [Fusarium fujikuroi IMI 58289]|uniref:Uncharacterized protein n=1 Tax=Gibberella fujikuroi (strain CBS 195.34 / IMI 58289 / NRRL A-6831) TaxID=1279085 RepID=S0EIJ0_GIBF5|nr:uncharacterized protein FFUJ_10508 [Fusarium fujikuroi IMI 58289]KLO94854.1 uncharacterized protein LW93_3541 [Fusarium fujikuroi]KLP01536.1 uncharacterized protein LW94_14397 [Fusarium fujikuroi]CCT74455.1 uncharacterized protein FFUJ_10508 [Fusarium fujikuroi IMI 58289]SCO05979.1 uncharacterized protein FFM5_08756 [Fusarium fujikuroi]SCO58228.1 uncharacterized protein FFMR_15384 [Fusarium fujikuroi]
MSQSTGATPGQSKPFLPPELSLRIIEESEEDCICLVNHLSRGQLRCDGGFQNHTTVIYTRGEKQRDGSLSRGRLEALPMQHRCVAGVIRASDTPALQFDPSDGYSHELEISHLTKRTIVAELGLDEDIANPVLNLDKHAFPPNYDPAIFINIRYIGYDLLDRHFIATVPVEIGGDEDIRHLLGITREQTALTRRLHPDDEKLACQKIKYLMIRENNVSAGDVSHVWSDMIETPDSKGGGEEAWVAYLEDNHEFKWEAAQIKPIDWLYLLKDLVRPGGQIHFIADRAPNTPYWPGPRGRVEVFEDGLQ